ncbi:MAG: hypothetical protein ACPLRM_05145, partial [Anaerolineae bacterium]
RRWVDLCLNRKGPEIRRLKEMLRRVTERGGLRPRPLSKGLTGHMTEREAHEYLARTVRALAAENEALKAKVASLQKKVNALRSTVQDIEEEIAG